MSQQNLFQKVKNDTDFLEKAAALFSELDGLDLEERVKIINQIKLELKKHSPFKAEPVDCVLWVKGVDVFANDYNPNSVAPPEMKLLEHSISQDGYTQPIVSFQHDGIYEVVDGFHRHRVGKESKEVLERIHGYLPVTIINDTRTDKGDRIASTIRHNRARGKHKVEAMSDIVVELKRRNWSDEKISKNLGMDPDEILRLMQITGLEELFKDKEFSKAWDVEGSVSELDFKELSDDEEAPPELEAKCWAPSWRRMCKVILRNDYWCKGLGQAQPKSEAYEKFKAMKRALKGT